MTTPFQFKVKKQRGGGLRDPAITASDIYKPAPKENLPLLGSLEEGRLYVALMKAGYRNVQVQVPIWGGRASRGGYVIDFVVYNPAPIPIMMNGAHWHRDGSEEFAARAAIFQVYGREPIVIWDYEIPNQEMSDQAVLKHLGRA